MGFSPEDRGLNRTKPHWVEGQCRSVRSHGLNAFPSGAATCPGLLTFGARAVKLGRTWAVDGCDSCEDTGGSSIIQVLYYIHECER